MTSVRWHVCDTAAEVKIQAVTWIANVAADAIARRGTFRIVLAGGETPRDVYKNLRGIQTDWTAWHVWFSDEKCLAADNPHRNSRMAWDALLGHVSIPEGQVHVFRVELGADKAMADYCKTLAGVPEFDLVLLGLGVDGHTASLFPGLSWGNSSVAPDVLAVRDAPKLPAERVSLSACRLSRARGALFLVCGASKRAAVSAWRAGASLPAAAIRSLSGVDVLVENVCLETIV